MNAGSRSEIAARPRAARAPARTVFWLCLLLAVSTATVYWPVARCGFVNFDDPDYVTENSRVKAGLSWENVCWALTTDTAGNWHPATWLSHMVDCQLFGLNPTGHHLTNVFLHAVNSVLLFIVLRLLTGATWRSGFVAALFALHPLHVESVAWVAERKDVLSGFFFMLTLWAYTRYVENRDGDEVRTAKSQLRKTFVLWYGLALLFFVLGLMSKPMLVTLPFVLMLLDYWPLRRIRLANGKPKIRTLLPLFWEKVPFLALSAGSSIVTLVVQQRTIPSMDLLPVSVRLQNVLVSYWSYLRKLAFPSDLAAYYPYWPSFPVGVLALAAVVLIVLSLLCLSAPGRRPFLAFGWLWYLGMLVPVIGFVQVGLQSMADRYMYLPSIGPFVAIVWGLSELWLKAGSTNQNQPSPSPVASRNTSKGISPGLETMPLDVVKAGCPRESDNPDGSPVNSRLFAAVVVFLGLAMILAALTRTQVQYWKDTETLFQHAVDVTTNNPIALLNLGSALVARGRIAEAAAQFAEAIRIAPRYPEAQSNFGFTLALQQRYAEAILHYRASLAVKPQAKTHYLLGRALAAQGKQLEAMAEYRAALEMDMDSPGPLNDLAWALATAADAQLRNGVEAVTLAERCCRLTGFKEALFVGTLAAAYAEAGRFDEAVKMGERARDLAAGAGNKDLAEKNRELLDLYRARKAFHEGSS